MTIVGHTFSVEVIMAILPAILGIGDFPPLRVMAIVVLAMVQVCRRVSISSIVNV